MVDVNSPVFPKPIHSRFPKTQQDDKSQAHRIHENINYGQINSQFHKVDTYLESVASLESIPCSDTGSYLAHPNTSLLNVNSYMSNNNSSLHLPSDPIISKASIPSSNLHTHLGDYGYPVNFFPNGLALRSPSSTDKVQWPPKNGKPHPDNKTKKPSKKLKSLALKPTVPSKRRSSTPVICVTPPDLFYDTPPIEDEPLDWDGPSDLRNPKNWSCYKRWYVTIVTGYLCLVVSFGCSLYTADTLKLIFRFGVSQEKTMVGLTVYLIGLSLAPVIGAPLSEKFGRKWIYVGMIPSSMVFMAGTVASTNMNSVLVCRFFTGLFGSPVLAIAAGTIADLWDIDMLVIAMTIFSLAPLMGPVLGPIIGGYAVQNFKTSWKLVFYIQLAFAGAALPFVLFMPETYKPIILQNEAKKKEKVRQQVMIGSNKTMENLITNNNSNTDVTLVSETSIVHNHMLSNWPVTASIHNDHMQDKKEHSWAHYFTKVRKSLTATLFFPIKLLFEEPIILIASIYASFVFAILFSFLESYAIIFGEIYKFTFGETGLAFWGIGTGMVLSAIFFICVDRFYLQKLFEAQKAKHPNSNQSVAHPVSIEIPFEDPEQVLIVCKVGSILLPISLFWQGWVAHFRLHWMLVIAAGVPFGISLMFIFFSLIVYFEFTYDNNPELLASVFAANNLLRYLLAAGFPLFTTKMYTNLGVNWSATIFGCISILLVPIPWVFARFGPRMRRHSKYANRPVDLKSEENNEDIKTGARHPSDEAIGNIYGEPNRYRVESTITFKHDDSDASDYEKDYIDSTYNFKRA